MTDRRRSKRTMVGGRRGGMGRRTMIRSRVRTINARNSIR